MFVKDEIGIVETTKRSPPGGMAQKCMPQKSITRCPGLSNANEFHTKDSLWQEDLWDSSQHKKSFKNFECSSMYQIEMPYFISRA